MKILKFYENIEYDFEVDDYVLVKINITSIILKNRIEINNYINNTIGKVYKFNNEKHIIYVLYENVPENIQHYFNKKGNSNFYRGFDFDRIVEHSKTIDELKMKLKTKKFNI